MSLKKIGCLVTLTVLATLALSIPQPVSGFVVCQITGTNYSYPTQANPGQPVALSVTLSGACSPSDTGWYAARVDIVSRSNTILTSNSGAMSFRANNGYPFTVTISDNLTAPTIPGSWNLQYVVYVFVSNGSGDEIDYKAIKPVAIQVGQPIAVTTVENMTTNSTSSSPTLATNSATATSLALQTVAQNAEQISNQNDTYLVLAVIFAALFLAALGLYLKERRKKTTA